MIYLIAALGILVALFGAWGKWQSNEARAAKADLKIAIVARDTAINANRELAASIGDTRAQCKAALDTLAQAERAANEKAAAAAKAKGEADKRLASQKATLEEWRRIAADARAQADDCALAKSILSGVPR